MAVRSGDGGIYLSSSNWCNLSSQIRSYSRLPGLKHHCNSNNSGIYSYSVSELCRSVQQFRYKNCYLCGSVSSMDYYWCQDNGFDNSCMADTGNLLCRICICWYHTTYFCRISWIPDSLQRWSNWSCTKTRISAYWSDYTTVFCNPVFICINCD